MRAPLILALLLALAAPARAQDRTVRAAASLVENHLLVHVLLQGKDVLAVLETGSGVSLLDSNYAKANGVDLSSRGGRGPPPFGGRGGRGPRLINGQAADFASAMTMGFGGQDFRFSPTVTDLSSVVKALGAPILLGRDMFRQWVVEIDFDAGAVTLHPREGFTPPRGAQSLPLGQPQGPRGPMTVALAIENGASLQAVIDTGDERPLGVNLTTARALGLDQRPSDVYHGVGLNLTTDDRIVTAHSVQLGVSKLSEIPAAIVADDTPVFGQDAVRIGLPLLQRFHLWIDLQGGQLWLTPGKRLATPFIKDTLGFHGQLDGQKVVVEGVAPSSPASAAGLKTGDIIVSINQQPAASLLANRPWNYLIALRMVLSDGRVLKLQPAEFY